MKKPHITATPWHGMTLSIWFRLLKRHRFRVAWSRWPLAASITLEATFNSLARPISEAVFSRRAREIRLSPPPIFLLGHWRTGTTLLHELVTRDPRFGFATTYQCTSPHHFALTQRLIPRLFAWTLPKRRAMDEMPLAYDTPQEDEFALCNLGAVSPYLFLAFPNRAGSVYDELALNNLTASDVERWRQALLWFLRRIAIADQRQLVLKSPPHTARVRILRELFPEAKFVHIVRDPYPTIASTIHTWRRITHEMALCPADPQLLEDVVLQSFQTMYDRFFEQVSSLPATQFHEVRYEDLVAKPVEEMRQIYQRLRLQDFERAAPGIRDYFREREGYQPNRHHITTQLADRITEVSGTYRQRYGYEARSGLT